MLIITTRYNSNPATGKGSITAKGYGKQRTVPIDHSLTSDAKHASAVGALVNVLTDSRQQAMLKHPSGGQRLSREFDRDSSGGTIVRWFVNV